jgi:hypothetical protein
MEVYVPKDKLEDLYVRQNLSSTQVAGLVGCSHKTITRLLWKYGLPVKKKGKNPDRFQGCGFCANVLRTLYVDEKMSSGQISRLFGVRENKAAKWLKICNIPRRSYSAANRNRPLKENVKFYRGKKVDGKKVDVHRLVAEQKLGRKLRPGEVVHHIDGNKLNNDPSNLQVMTARQHLRFHALQSGFGGGKVRITPQQETAIRNYLKAGYPQRKIAEMLNVSRWTVRGVLYRSRRKSA